MKAYIVGGEKELVNFLPDIEITNNLKEAKLVIFGDGPIVSPSLYKEKKLADVNLKCDINRDRSDKAIFTKMKPDQIALGIGRGACFLAVMNGASLIQYCYRSQVSRSYLVEFKVRDRIYVSPAISDWKQTINLEKCEGFELLGKSDCCDDYNASADVKRFMRHNGNPELIKFKKDKNPISICVQFHPEWMPKSYLSKLVKEIVYECAN